MHMCMQVCSTQALQLVVVAIPVAAETAAMPRRLPGLIVARIASLGLQLRPRELPAVVARSPREAPEMEGCFLMSRRQGVGALPKCRQDLISLPWSSLRDLLPLVMSLFLLVQRQKIEQVDRMQSMGMISHRTRSKTQATNI